MTLINRFESVFEAAAKTGYRHADVPLKRVLVITDLDAQAAQRYQRQLEDTLPALPPAAQWDCLHLQEAAGLASLIERIQSGSWDLLISYRHVSAPSPYPFTLGSHLSALTQVVDVPVLVTPRPGPDGAMSGRPPCTQIMVLTDDLVQADRLIHWGVRFASSDAALCLVHLEDDLAFERYLGAIAKIPEIDTKKARERIRERLLSDPQDHAESCRQALVALGWRPEQIREEVRMGHRIRDVQALIQEEKTDLLVLHTKDDDQLAMHGLAHPIAVEFRDTPMLML